MPLQSGFIAIATSGNTVDNRKIEASWLEDAAAAYDPDLYTAVLDLNHWDPRWAGTYGKVIALDSIKDKDGVVTLRANIEPNEALIAMSKKEVLFTSVELTPNFRKTGKDYLTGLAVTPKPASVGTEQLKFSCDNTDKSIRTDFIQVALTFSEHEDTKPKSFFQKLFSKTTTNSLEDIMANLTEERVMNVVEFVEKQRDKDVASDRANITFTEVEAQSLLKAQGYSIIKEPTADDVATAQALLKAQGFSVEKTATKEEIAIAEKLLKAQGFAVEKTPADEGKPDDKGDKTKTVITREQFTSLAEKFADASVTEFNFTANADQPGGDDSMEYV